ncbi:polysaccharide biosynthesis C-terminal domain-containing protein [Leptothoe sp. LEGE 181152]|nr:polysaccharide biosynthesis C-terminal domain-containing protein [Leptothoe sp. LEGE 181152]
MNRASKAVLTYSSSTAVSISITLIGFYITPKLIGYLGDEAFGAFRVAMDWVAYLSIITIGIGGGLLPLLSKSIAQRDKNGIYDVLKIGLEAYCKATVLMLLLGICLVIFITKLVPVEPEHTFGLQLGVLISLFSILLAPLAIYPLLAQVKQLGYFINFSNLLQSLVIYISSISFAILGWSIAGQFLALLLGSFFNLFFIIYILSNEYPIKSLIGIFKRSHDLTGLKVLLWQGSLKNILMALGGRLSIMTDNIVIAAVIGPSSVVSFFLTQKLCLIAQTQMQGIANASWAGLAELYFSGEFETLSVKIIEVTKLTSILGGIFLIPVVIFNGSFLSLWIGPDKYAGALVTQVAAMNSMLLALFSVWALPIKAIGKVEQLLPPIICSSLINVVLSIRLSYSLGIAGPLIGTLLSFLLTYAWWYPVLIKKNFRVPLRLLIFSVLKPLFLSLFFILMCQFLYPIFFDFPEDWVSLIFNMSLVSVLYMISTWLFLLTDLERSMWKNRLLGPLRR